MPGDPFEPGEGRHFEPADPRTQEELGGVLERAFSRERGREPNEEEALRRQALAEEALRHAETKLSLAREAENAMSRAAERYGRLHEPDDLAELERWKSAAEMYRREAREFADRAELLRQRLA